MNYSYHSRGLFGHLEIDVPAEILVNRVQIKLKITCLYRHTEYIYRFTLFMAGAKK